MALGIHVWEAALHRETYITLLSSLLKERGSKKRLARELGITPQYLSYLMVRDIDPDHLASTKRTPSVELCHRLVRTLELPAEKRDSLLGHLLLSRQNLNEAIDTASTAWSFSVAVEQVERTAIDAYTAQDPIVYGRRCQGLYTFLLALLRRLRAEECPQLYTIAAFDVCGAADLQGRFGQSVYHAKLARFVFEHMADRRDIDQAWRKKRWCGCLIAEANALMNLELFKQAYMCCQQVEHKFRLEPIMKMHFLSHKIRVLGHIPRVPAYQLKDLFTEATTLYERHTTEPGMALDYFFVHLSLARAYIHRRTPRQVERLLEDQANFIASVERNPLHTVELLQIRTRLYEQTEDWENWEHTMHLALDLAREAQLAQMFKGLELQMQEHDERQSGSHPGTRIS